MSGTVLRTLETGSLFFIKPRGKKVTLVKTTDAPPLHETYNIFSS